MKIRDWEIKQQIGIKVIPGQIDVSCAWVSLYSDSLIIVEIDCRSKYPGVGPKSSHSVALVATDHTLSAIDTDKITEIQLNLPEGFQIGPAETSRYTVSLFCYKQDDNNGGVMIWQNI